MKTAVEWLISELMSKGIINADGWVWDDDVSIVDITNQAKAMEKEQIGYPKEKVDKLIDALYNNNMCSVEGDELIETFKS